MVKAFAFSAALLLSLAVVACGWGEAEAVATAAEEMVLGSKEPIDALNEAAERATKEIQGYERRLGR